jgi:hypothetical protein
MGQSIGDRARTSGRSYEERLQTRTSLHVRLVQHVTEPSKVVAKKIGASADTVDLHRQGGVPQSWAQMIAYCRAYPAFGLEVLELIGIDIDRDRDAYATFLQLQKQVRGE